LIATFDRNILISIFECVHATINIRKRLNVKIFEARRAKRGGLEDGIRRLADDGSTILASGKQQLVPYESILPEAIFTPLLHNPHLSLFVAAYRRSGPSETARNVWISDPKSPPSSSFSGLILATGRKTARYI
jgi:hypothetical protein